MDEEDYEKIVRTIVAVIEKRSPITQLFNREQMVDFIMIDTFHDDDVAEYLGLME